MYLYNTWEETGDESIECRALRKFLRQIELHKTGQVYWHDNFSDTSSVHKHEHKLFIDIKIDR